MHTPARGLVPSTGTGTVTSTIVSGKCVPLPSTRTGTSTSTRLVLPVWVATPGTTKRWFWCNCWWLYCYKNTSEGCKYVHASWCFWHPLQILLLLVYTSQLALVLLVWPLRVVSAYDTISYLLQLFIECMSSCASLAHSVSVSVQCTLASDHCCIALVVY